jgi:hypothetical protein
MLGLESGQDEAESSQGTKQRLRYSGEKGSRVPFFSSIIFAVVQWAARRGLRGEPEGALTASPRRDGAAELK